MKTEHFDIYFYPEEKAGVEIAARMAERWYSRLQPAAAPRTARPPAPHPLRLARRLRADQRDWRRDRRRHRRRHRADRASNRAAPRGPARRNRSRDRTRTGARVPVRHDHADRGACRHDRPPTAPAVVRGRDGRVPLDRPARSQHRDVAARRGAPGAAARDQGSRRPRVLSVSLGPGVLVLRRRPVRRSGDAPAPRSWARPSPTTRRSNRSSA